MVKEENLNHNFPNKGEWTIPLNLLIVMNFYNENKCCNSLKV